jgi:molybdopterin converting factor subunit 1
MFSMNKVKLTILFFATLRERAGMRQTTLEVDGPLTIRGLRAALGDRFPSMAASLPTALVAVNREYAFDEDEIPSGAEVALFPPVSGG